MFMLWKYFCFENAEKEFKSEKWNLESSQLNLFLFNFDQKYMHTMHCKHLTCLTEIKTSTVKFQVILSSNTVDILVYYNWFQFFGAVISYYSVFQCKFDPISQQGSNFSSIRFFEKSFHSSKEDKTLIWWFLAGVPHVDY